MKKISILFLMILVMTNLSAQIQQEPADAFLKRVSESYAAIKDYRARIVMTKQGITQVGTLYYVTPDRLKIEYTNPARQVLLIAGNLLQLYLPQYEVVMEQRLGKGGKTVEEMGGIGAGRGLEILQKNYSVSYINNGKTEPLVPGSAEMVIKLQFRWRVHSEGFRSLEIAINPNNLLIRRVTGITSLFESIQFNFTNIRLNSNIPQTIFTLEFSDDSRINRYPNFIYGTEEAS